MLKIYNTLTKAKEKFKEINKGDVSFYQCGPTVYWVQHIGNLRAVVLNDFMVRTLLYLNYHVKLVRNYTDVGHLTSDNDFGEDKMSKAAVKEKQTPKQIATKYTNIFEKDLLALNVTKPYAAPMATAHIQDMITMIQTLIEKKFAYQTSLAIYFDVSKVKNYTVLSGQNLDKNIQNAGSGEVSDAEKKHPMDFALWFFKKGKHINAIQTWPSPWGEGFPGWHIECSSMAKKYLGTTIDIHMGGIEHIPVHHTNEIAQSESANGKKFVNYWVHNEHLTMDNNKLSKSDGTAITLADVKEQGYDPMVLRYFYLGAHYRAKQNFTWEALTAAQTALKKLHNEIVNLKSSINNMQDVNSDLDNVANEKYREQFINAISDDFNMPQALAILWQLIKDDKVLNTQKYATIIDFDRVFGLKLADIKLEKLQISPDIQAMVDNRNKFRELGDFEQADAIRVEMEAMGYEIEDTVNGTIVKQK